MIRQVTTFIDIGHERSGKGITGIKEPQEGYRYLIIYLPAIFRSVCLNGKQLFHILPPECCTVTSVMSESDIQAAIGIDLKIEITFFSLRPEEEFQAAVLTDRRQGFRILRTDIRLLYI